MLLTLAGALSHAVVAVTAPATPSSHSRIHGRIVSIDAAHGTFQIHHDPFPAMPMAMTMIVKPVNPAALKNLHVGETIDATVDTALDPWSISNITPAAPAGKAAP